MGPQTEKRRQKILIADDSEMNRAILSDMLSSEFEIIEAADGAEAVATLSRLGSAISLVLLDVVMPNMDGYEVLAVMNREGWIEDIPVIMISAENRSAYIERAYELGVSDFISRPYDALVVHRRVVNTIMLYAKQKKLVGLVADQIYQREKTSSLMINILSHIVEFRNGESGLHVLHIHTMTEILLQQLAKITDQYALTPGTISLISTASALHDIGKIAIDETILNKPGPLTPEEFEVVKTHSMVGAKMLRDLPFFTDEPLIRTAYEICRWHHERWDGRGYPDGLKGEDIPISAQVVALADVYDALTSRRVYKDAYSHDQAMKMIMNGEAGAFNPLVLRCLTEAGWKIQAELKVNSLHRTTRIEVRNLAEELLRYEELTSSERTLRQLEHEREKARFFASLDREVQFEYTLSSDMLVFSEWGAQRLGLPETLLAPLQDERVKRLMPEADQQAADKAMRATTPENSDFQLRCTILLGDEAIPCRLACRILWSTEKPRYRVGAYGKLTQIEEDA